MRLLRFGGVREGLHEVGYGGLGGVVEGAEAFDDAGLVGCGAVLVELVLAFEAGDGELEADDGFELAIDVCGRERR